MLISDSLESGWHLHAQSGPVPLELTEVLTTQGIPAIVPGDVHMALLASGLIPDPHDSLNEAEVSWIANTAWEYSISVPHQPADREQIDLVFDGVDTIATLSVAGQTRSTHSNMHTSWRVPLPELATDSASVVIRLDSATAHAQEQLALLGKRYGAFSDLPSFIRKKACDFGWDWGPALTGAGIWKSVRIERWSVARLAAVRPTATVLDSGDGQVLVDLDIARTPHGTSPVLEVEVSLGKDAVVQKVLPQEARVRLALAVSQPALWWPTGLGEAIRHRLEVTLRVVDTAEILDSSVQHIGFRNLTVDEVPDPSGDGMSFGITVNGHPMFIRGFNWIPDHTSISEVTAADYQQGVDDALEIGANMLRVWGGGIYESEVFYDICDAAGMLVWQDFLFACAAYPEEGHLPKEIAAEARENISRIMHHPSLAMWNGNNENLWFWFLHDWETKLADKTWGEKYYFEMLPQLVTDLDPSRHYIPGSPSSGDRWRDPNDPTIGVVHWWLWGDYRDYDQVTPRFVSEFGFQGPPGRSTFDAVVHDLDPGPFSPQVAQRQKAVGGTERINEVLNIHFGVPTNFDEWYWLAQLNQARAVRYGVERFRSLSPYCRGSIVWQLNDCWPVMSWSAIDSAGVWKPLAWALQQAYADYLVTARPGANGTTSVHLANSGTKAWNPEVQIAVVRQGLVVDHYSIPALVEPGTALELELPDSLDHLPADTVLVATAGASRSVLLGAVERDFQHLLGTYDLELTHRSESVAITITANLLIRELFLAIDEVDPAARADKNLVTLLPNESIIITVATKNPGAFTADAVHGVARQAHAATAMDENFRGLNDVEQA